MDEYRRDERTPKEITDEAIANMKRDMAELAAKIRNRSTPSRGSGKC